MTASGALVTQGCSGDTPLQGYAANPHIVFLEKSCKLDYFEFGMKHKIVCVTCKNKGCVARCQFQRLDPEKLRTVSIKKEVFK